MYDFKLYWHLLFLVSTVNGCASIPAFAFLVVIPISIISSAVAITAGIKTYKWIIKKKRKKSWQNSTAKN